MSFFAPDLFAVTFKLPFFFALNWHFPICTTSSKTASHFEWFHRCRVAHVDPHMIGRLDSKFMTRTSTTTARFARRLTRTARPTMPDSPCKLSPEIVHVYPQVQKNLNFISHVAQFIFPDAMSDSIIRKPEVYSFVVTDTAGVQRWGYVDRKLMNGEKHPPTCFCILSAYPCMACLYIARVQISRLTRAYVRALHEQVSIYSTWC
jgi:hypothetical protein